jgi:hypothetical protein
MFKKTHYPANRRAKATTLDECLTYHAESILEGMILLSLVCEDSERERAMWSIARFVEGYLNVPQRRAIERAVRITQKNVEKKCCLLSC